jgi:hypothetical protein
MVLKSAILQYLLTYLVLYYNEQCETGPNIMLVICFGAD